MLPHNHFLIAALTIAPAARILNPQQPTTEVVQWVLLGGVLSASIDLDVIALVALRSREEPRLRPFRNLFTVYRQFDRFMDTIQETGVLRSAMITHSATSAVLLLASAVLAPAYIVPVGLAVLSHIASDIPNIRRALFS